MSKIISIKLTKVGPTAGPFDIYDQSENLIAEDVSKDDLINGVSYTVDDDVSMVKLVSKGSCINEKWVVVSTITESQFFDIPTEIISTGCVWRHLKNPEIYNTFYGKVEPYIIEYPFAYQYHDEILQSVKDYTRAYQYIADEYGVSNEPNKIEVDGIWFNKAIIYNGQQCSGMLTLAPKPVNNLKSYMSYPIYGEDTKTIVYTKSDNWYQYNTFWSIVKDKTQPIFTRTCSPLSYDKEINQTNMDYTTRSFKKEPIRAKEVKIRHILDDRGDVHLVSQMIFTSSQISYK